MLATFPESKATMLVHTWMLVCKLLQELLCPQWLALAAAGTPDALHKQSRHGCVSLNEPASQCFAAIIHNNKYGST